MIALLLLVSAMGVERFAYYAERAILVLAMRDVGTPASEVNRIYALATETSALAPIVGGLFALAAGPRLLALVGTLGAAGGYALFAFTSSDGVLEPSIAAGALSCLLYFGFVAATRRPIVPLRAYGLLLATAAAIVTPAILAGSATAVGTASCVAGFVGAFTHPIGTAYAALASGPRTTPLVIAFWTTAPFLARILPLYTGEEGAPTFVVFPLGMFAMVGFALIARRAHYLHEWSFDPRPEPEPIVISLGLAGEGGLDEALGVF